MCTGLELLALAGTTATVASALNKPKAPNIPAPEKPPQSSKTADRNTAVGANTAAAMPGGSLAGNAGTFLTGPGGIDPGSLSLGKNTLLGQ